MLKAAMIKETARCAGLALKKHSPEILTGLGLASLVSATVLACRSTLKSGDILDETKADLDDVKKAKIVVAEALDSGEELDEEKKEDYEAYLKVGATKEVAGIYGKTVLKFAKLYAPTIILTAVGITSILCGHNIMRKRNLAITAAYAALDRSFNEYRKRVADKYGEDEERNIKHNIKTESIKTEITDEKGKKKTVEKKVSTVNSPSIYARFFDESCYGWSKSPESNLLFLRGVEQEWNDKLAIRRDGIVFLNEIYKDLGIPMSQAGALVGWVYDPNEVHQIDFGIYTDENNERVRDFVNGYERSILLDFNVDVVYDKLQEDRPFDSPGTGNF